MELTTLAEGADVQSALFKGFAGAAAVFAHIEGDGGVGAAQVFPVGHFAREHILDLGLGQAGHAVGGVDRHGHAVDGEGEGDQAVLGNFRILERPAGIADLDQALAHLLHTHTGAAARHGDADVGITLHNGLSGQLHDRDVGRAPGNVQRAFLIVEGIERGGDGERCAQQRKDRGGEQTFHGRLLTSRPRRDG